MTIATTEKPTKCDRCGFLPDPSPYADGTDVLDEDGLCYPCARVMAFASFLQGSDPEMRWELIADVFEAIRDFDEIDAEKAKADA